MLIEDINDALAFLRTNEIVELKGQKANNFNKQLTKRKFHVYGHKRQNIETSFLYVCAIVAAL